MQQVRPGGKRPVRKHMPNKESPMTKAQDSKKESKKEPAKTMKEKKEAKKVKKEERSRQ